MIQKTQPIGVFDSGTGGLSVLKQFIRFLPHESYIYLGDTARVPYGSKSEDTVKRYARECVNFLIEKNVKLIVAACNTVSAVAMDAVREATDLPVIGMILPAAGASLRETSSKRIGVIGTRATIDSGAYFKAITELADKDKVDVFSQACPLFVPIVEEGWVRHPATKMIAEEYLANLKQANIDTLVLGCTHYPLLNQLFTEIMPDVNLIDSGEHAAVNAIRLLAERNALIDEKSEFVKKPNIEFYVTDVPSTFFEIAKRFLGFPVESPRKIDIGSSANKDIVI